MGRRRRWIRPSQPGRLASNLQGAARKRWWRVTLADVPPNPLPFLSPLFFYLLQATHLTSPSAIFFQVPPQREVWLITAVKLMRAFKDGRVPILFLLVFRCFQAAIVKDARSQVRNMSFSSQNNSFGRISPLKHFEHTEKGNFEQNLCQRKKRDVRITRSAYSTLV